MNNFYFAVIGFLVCTVIIVFQGAKLTKYGNTIAELSGMGRVWVGLILMASITSLPELMIGVSSVAILQEPDLAAGDIFGSCVFNLLILSFVDTQIKKPLTSLVKPGHLFAGLFSIVLLATCGIAILLKEETPELIWISPFTLLIFVIYLLAIHGIYKNEHYENSQLIANKKKSLNDRKELKDTLIKYVLNGIFVIVAAAFLPYFGETIATQSGLSNTFFATLFLAASTSLPELVVSIVAIRLASYDLLVGNLFGSNIFNIFILGLDDVFYTKGSLFSGINEVHLETIIIVISMTAVVGLGILAKPTRKIWRLSVDTVIVLLLYIGLISILFFR